MSIKAEDNIMLESKKPIYDISSDTAQHFWFWDTIPTGKDPLVGTGAHISEVPESEFNDPDSPDYHAGGNLLARSNGIAVRGGLEELASFGPTQARVGMDGDANVIIEPRRTLFHGNNGALVGEISSDELISGEYKQRFMTAEIETSRMEDYYNYVNIDDVPSVKWCEKNIKYPPTSQNITASLSYNSSSSDEISVPANQDSDITQNGIRVVYDNDNRMMSVYAVTKRNVDLIYAKLVLYWSSAIQTYPRHYAGNIEFAAEENIDSSVTLSRTPISSSSVVVYITTNSAYWQYLNNNSAFISFTSGTSETKTEQLYNGATGSWVTCTVTYNSNTKTITATNCYIAGISYTATAFTFKEISATYDRDYYAPQFSFGVSNELGENGFATLMGEGLTASASHQTVFGRYNATNADDAFEIGSGEYGVANKNAMAVKWNGNTTIAGTLTQSSDKRLKEHISYLDEDAVKFIRKLKPAHFIKDEARHVGFYAQDVQEADEWDCMTGEMNGYMTLGYTELIAPLVAYCQHLEDRIRKLEEK